MKRSELVAAAKELNVVLGIEPPIKIKDPAKQLESAIRQAAELIDPAEDEFTEQTQAVLDALVDKPAAEGPKAAPKEEEKPAPKEKAAPTSVSKPEEKPVIKSRFVVSGEVLAEFLNGKTEVMAVHQLSDIAHERYKGSDYRKIAQRAMVTAIQVLKGAGFLAYDQDSKEVRKV